MEITANYPLPISQKLKTKCTATALETTEILTILTFDLFKGKAKK